MICPKCKVEKLPADFNKSQEHCRSCHSDYYQSNRDRHIANVRRTSAIVRQRNKEFVYGWLSTHACVDCGEADPLVLEFDHVRGKKKKAVSTLMWQCGSVESLEEEIGKCEVRCANCHRRVTHLRRSAV